MRHPESFENGRYKVICPRGEGGMAFVYLAVDTRLGRAVAIKMPRPNLLAHLNVIGRFAQETVTMARATHPHVVTLYEAGAEYLPDGTRTPYLVMEYVAGVNAEDVFDPRDSERFGAMSPRLASSIILPVLSALVELHAGGLIHRDIKPANIMVGWNPDVVKLMDFGIARIIQDAADDDRQTKTAMAMLTMGYSAPEQQLSAKAADARADVYAVAASLYAMVTGIVPKDLHNHGLSDSEFLSVPECLRSVIHGATRYDPDAREYQSAVMLMRAVRLAIRDEPEDDGSALRDWLKARRATSSVEAALSRAFGRGYTIVPEAGEADTAGYTKWFDREIAGESPETSEPESAPPAATSIPPTGRRRSFVMVAGGLAATAVVAMIAFAVPWPGVRSGVSEPKPVAIEEAIPASVPIAVAPEPVATVEPSPPQEVVDVPAPPSSKGKARVPVEKAKLPPTAPQGPVIEAADVSVDPVPEPMQPRGTVRLASGADSLSLVTANNTVYPAGTVPPGTYRLSAVFPTKGNAPNAGTVTVAANETVVVVCAETFKLCKPQ